MKSVDQFEFGLKVGIGIGAYENFKFTRFGDKLQVGIIKF